jgi:hypothetical protein
VHRHATKRPLPTQPKRCPALPPPFPTETRSHCSPHTPNRVCLLAWSHDLRTELQFTLSAGIMGMKKVGLWLSWQGNSHTESDGFWGTAWFSQRCHAPGVITFKAGGHLKAKQKCCFVTIPAPVVTLGIPSASTPVRTRWSPYQKRISGPLLDRIDIHIEVPRVEYEKLLGEP